MIFVNSGGGGYWWMEHATWNGLHVADVVFPSFLWIMGVCIPISLNGQLARAMPRSQIIIQVVVVIDILGITRKKTFGNISYLFCLWCRFHLSAPSNYFS